MHLSGLREAELRGVQKITLKRRQGELSVTNFRGRSVKRVAHYGVLSARRKCTRI